MQAGAGALAAVVVALPAGAEPTTEAEADTDGGDPSRRGREGEHDATDNESAIKLQDDDVRILAT